MYVYIHTYYIYIYTHILSSGPRHPGVDQREQALEGQLPRAREADVILADHIIGVTIIYTIIIIIIIMIIRIIIMFSIRRIIIMTIIYY